MAEKYDWGEDMERVRKIICIVVFALCCCLLAGCGKESGDGTIDRESAEIRRPVVEDGVIVASLDGVKAMVASMEYFDFLVDKVSLEDMGVDRENIVLPESLLELGSVDEDTEIDAGFLGMQFYQNEPVQIWAFRNGYHAEVYLYKQDGSRTCLVQGRMVDYFYGTGYLDQEGNYYHCRQGLQGAVIKVNPEGEVLFDRKLWDDGIYSIGDMLQLPDGNFLVTYYEAIMKDNKPGSGDEYLGILNQDTGAIEKIQRIVLEDYWFGRLGESPCCMMNDGIWAFDVEDGSKELVLPFGETSYIFESSIMYDIAWDFQVNEEGDIEILWADDEGKHLALETLRIADAARGRTPVVIRGLYLTYNTWLKQQVATFNQENEKYYIVMQSGLNSDDLDNFMRQTSIEIATGKGPDILYGDVLGDYVYGVVQKGGFADLAPYMESSGIREEDYFPSAFNLWRDGDRIYSVNVRLDCLRYHMDAAVLDGEGEPDMEALVDGLLAWEKEAVFLDTAEEIPGIQKVRKADIQEVLEILLESSESLYGMVSWETGTCDFSGGLLGKILMVAERYGYNGKNDYPALVKKDFLWPYHYVDSVMLEEEGRVVMAPMFDDGCHAQVRPKEVLSINANSPSKEGAWEFICYLLEEEVQGAVDSLTEYPVNKAVFEKMMAKELEEGRITQDGKVQTTKGYYDITEERVDELRAILEDARFFPTRNLPILDIIYEEAGDYFNGIKGIDEITTIIENRVQVYLDEVR